MLARNACHTAVPVHGPAQTSSGRCELFGCAKLPAPITSKGAQKRVRAVCESPHWNRKVLKSKVRCHATAGRVAVMSAIVASATTDHEDTRATAFLSLAKSAGVDMQLELRASGPPRFSGLFTPQPAKKGQVLMHIPAAVCLVVDYVAGIRLPSEGSWPNLVALGLKSPKPVPWDLLLALALVDADVGHGGQFWKEYISSILPGAEDLSVPFCLPESMLPQLQDNTVEFGAMAQKDRLASEFPSLASPQEDGSLPPLLRFFGCVRSRAFKASDDCFAFVPFLDAANHSSDPNADFRYTEQGDWQLVAVKDITSGDEVCISYTGQPGYSNRRLMVQYGFVPMGGNSADHLDLQGVLGLSAAEIGAAKLSSTRMQEAVGETAFLDMLAGRNMYLYQAIKSVPMVDDEENPSSSSDSLDTKLADAVLQACQRTLAGYPTTLEEDESALQDILTDSNRDTRLLAVVTYRMEKKKLLSCIQDVMEKYLAAAK